MTADADPIVAAVAEALREWDHRDSGEEVMYGTLADWLTVAGEAVTAHRRAVLDQRDDGDRWAQVRSVLWSASAAAWVSEQVPDLLAALADETIARRQAEANRDILARLRDEALGKSTDYCEMIAAVRARGADLLNGELAHRSRDYGRGVAQATKDMLAALDGPKDG